MKKLFFGLKAKAKTIIRNSRKQIAIGLTVGAVAVGVSAFTKYDVRANEASDSVTFFFSETANPMDTDDIKNTGNWNEGSDPQDACPDQTYLCAISVPQGSLDINGLPNPTALQNVAQHWLSTPGGGEISSTEIYVYKRD